MMEKFKTSLDSSPVIVINPDEQPMLLSTRAVAPTPSFAIIQLLIFDTFRIKGTHMQMIWDNQFDGRICFHKLDNETIVDALPRFKKMLRTCYGHGLTKGAIVQIFYHGLDDPTQGILDAGGIFLYNTLNGAFKILEDKVLLKLDFSDDSQNNPKLKTIVSASGSNINPDHEIFMEKFKALTTKIDSEFLKIRKELKEMRDGRRDNHALQIDIKDDMTMCELHEMAKKMKSNKRMKDQVVKLERQINQGLRNRKAIIENLERQFEYLEKIQSTKSLPHTTNTKPRHEFVYKPPSIHNENDNGTVKFVNEDEIKPILTMPNPNPIKSNSLTVSPFLKDCTMLIP
nr:reverse transcriptase domain-containing protein [Tanacetum cinerariifolium]